MWHIYNQATISLHNKNNFPGHCIHKYEDAKFGITNYDINYYKADESRCQSDIFQYYLKSDKIKQRTMIWKKRIHSKLEVWNQLERYKINCGTHTKALLFIHFANAEYSMALLHTVSISLQLEKCFKFRRFLRENMFRVPWKTSK